MISQVDIDALKVEYYEDCEDYKPDVMTGGCMYQIGMQSCVVDTHQYCVKERRGD